MSYVDCNDPDAQGCLDELIDEINDELTIACQVPFTVPKKEIARIVDRAKKWFYKSYEDSVESMYIAIPKIRWTEDGFAEGVDKSKTNPDKTNLASRRGAISLPEGVFSVNNVFEINRFSGEDGGFSSNSFSAGDKDFGIDKFVYSNLYGAGIGSESLMYYVINAKFIDNARQVLQQQISYSYNRNTHNLRFMGELPENDVVLEIYSKIPDCDLFQDEIFIRYCTAKAKTQLARILGTFNYNLPGNITINYDLILSEGQEELQQIIEEIKTDEGLDWFFTS